MCIRSAIQLLLQPTLSLPSTLWGALDSPLSVKARQTNTNAATDVINLSSTNIALFNLSSYGLTIQYHKNPVKSDQTDILIFARTAC